jgi:hypothetical protein
VIFSLRPLFYKNREMHYWRRDNFEGLLVMAAEAEKLGYQGFAVYCQLREKGLRLNAFETLMRFISEMRAASFAIRRDFVDWHQTFCLLNPKVMDASPKPLEKKLIEPTVTEWIAVSPDDPTALRWSDNEASMLRAAQINPNDKIAVTRLAVAVLNRVDYLTHELPSAYLGENPKEALAELHTILTLLNGNGSPAFAEELRSEAARQKDLIENYLDRDGGR